MAYVKLAPYNAPSAWKASATAVLPGVRDIDVIAPYVVPGNSIEIGPGTVVHPTTDGILWIWDKQNILLIGQGPTTILNIGGIYSNSGQIELGQFNMMGNVSPDCYASIFLAAGTTLTSNLYIHDIYSNMKAGNHFTVYVNGTTAYGATLKYLVFSRCLSEDADGMGFVFYGEGPAPSLEDVVLYRCKVKNAGIAPTRLYVPGTPPTCWICGIDISEYGGIYAAESFTKKVTVIKCEVDGTWLNAYHSEFAPAKTDIVYLDNTAKRSGQWANIDPPGYEYLGGFMMPYSPEPDLSQNKTHSDEVIMVGNTGDGTNIRADLALYSTAPGPYKYTSCYDFVLGSNKVPTRITQGNCTGIAVKNGTVWDVFLYSSNELPVNQQLTLPDGTPFTANFTDFLVQRGITAAPGYQPTGVMIPLYIYPGAAWDQVIAAKNAHPSVPIACIINSNSGPGTAYNATWSTYINKLVAAGIICYGYVWCGETNEFDNNRDCTQDVANWKSWYPGVTGIFVDGFHGGYVSSGEAQVARARTAGYTSVIGNPGMAVASNLLSSVDTACVYEAAGLPSVSVMQNLATTYGRNRSIFLAHDVPGISNDWLISASSYCQWLYTTNDILPNPWDTLPPYFAALIEEEEKIIMASYIFQPSEAKTAKLPLNLDPSLVGLALTAELFLSKDGGTTKTSTSGKVAFTAAATQNINLPINMPAAAGAYKAYIDILYGNAFFLGFVDVNDILIPGGSVGPIIWS